MAPVHGDEDAGMVREGVQIRWLEAVVGRSPFGSDVPAVAQRDEARANLVR